MTILIQNFALAGYRSFGSKLQYFEKLSKVNIVIGQNNSGKSNVLRFIKYALGIKDSRSADEAGPLDQHLPNRPPMQVGIGNPFNVEVGQIFSLLPDHRLISGITDQSRKGIVSERIARVYAEKARLEGASVCWSIFNFNDGKLAQAGWDNAIKVLSDSEVEWLWRFLNNVSGGSRQASWDPQVIVSIAGTVTKAPVVVIPAIRRIDSKGDDSRAFDGTGIINSLAKLQNPGAHDQQKRKGFLAITQFLREVTDHPNATIEIPYERDTILIHMDNKVLPIESLGSGIHEVIILAAASTVLSNHVICMEEPELHLNPILQRKLIRYLAAKTENQYFISTHSAALMDTDGAEIYHVQLLDGSSIVERVTSNDGRSSVCSDLGYHPSDLLQANCVLWVEGPSDRIYLNWWLSAIDSSLVEGIHYSIMFYGGRLASHLTNSSDDQELSEFISLRRLNRRSVMLIDSDRDAPRKHLNATKQRLEKEFDSGPGHAWISEGREIENYLPVAQVKAALKAICPNAIPLTNFERFDNVLKVKLPRGGEGQAGKIEIARYVIQNFSPDFTILDLQKRIAKVREFILASNPKYSEPD